MYSFYRCSGCGGEMQMSLEETIRSFTADYEKYNLFSPSEKPPFEPDYLVFVCADPLVCREAKIVKVEDFVSNIKTKIAETAWTAFITEAAKTTPPDEQITDYLINNIEELEALYTGSKNQLLKLYLKNAIEKKRKSSN